LILQEIPFNIFVAVRAWARLALCVVFMLAGANFSHGSELHHQLPGSNVSHHSVSDQDLTNPSNTPHKHFEPTNIEQGLEEIAIHCGSPELQPNEEFFHQNMLVIGAMNNCSQTALTNLVSSLEPPPPRS